MEEKREKRFYKLLIALIPLILNGKNISDFINPRYYNLVSILVLIGGSWILGVSFFDLVNDFTRIFDRDKEEKLTGKIAGVFANILYILIGIYYIMIAANYLLWVY